jgi:hypothetical protein
MVVPQGIIIRGGTRLGRVSDHLRSNVVGYVALFFALSGSTALALSGSNTVFSDDIVHDQVYSGDVRNDTLTGGGLAAADLRKGSVGSSEVQNDSLTGTDIDESTLGRPIYAKVNPYTGDVVAEESEGIGDANVYKPTGSTGIFCFRDLPFQPKSGVANSLSGAISVGVSVATSGYPNGCSQGDQAAVELRGTSDQQLINQYFTVWFTD